MRVTLFLFIALSLIAATPGPSPCPSSPPPVPEQRHSSGLVVLGPVPRCLASAFEPLAKPYSDARLLAEAYPNDFGYPWADQIKRELVISVTTTEGERLARSWMAGGATVAAGIKTAVLPPPPTVPVRLRTGTRSVAQIRQLEDEVVALGRAGVNDASAIHAVGADAEHGRIIIEVDHLSDGLVSTLVARFGTDAIAVRVDPASSRATTLSGRSDDTSGRWVYLSLAAGALVLLVGVGLALRRRRRSRQGID